MSKTLRIELGEKYVVTGSSNDLILSERKIAKEGKNAGQEILSRLGYFNKFEHLVREVLRKEILESEAQSLQELHDHLLSFSERMAKAVGL